MEMNSVLPDTNIITRLFAGDPRIKEVLETSKRVYVSVIVLGELLAGYAGGTKTRENRAKLEDLLRKSNVELSGINAGTSEYYALIYNQLKAQGTPIPTNDIWIAAQGLEHASSVLTLDDHFNHIANLKVWRPDS